MFTVMNEPNRTSSEAAILWFLKHLAATENRGADEEEILQQTGISKRTFNRAWYKLKKEGIVVREVTYRYNESAD